MQRSEGRALDQIRAINFELGVAPHASGSVLVSMGSTRVICGVMIEEIVPRWMKDQGVTGGWLTAEYSMLPYSTTTRKQRDIAKGRLDGRSSEIQRLIGRALRSVIDLEKLGPRTMWIDCDVLQADGGTRTAAITGAFVALHDAVSWLQAKKQLAQQPIRDFVAAISVGIHQGAPVLDLDYGEDSGADADANFVLTGQGRIVEVQATAERAVFGDAELAAMLALARKGIGELTQLQRQATGL